jgi:hypothetical protein
MDILDTRDLNERLDELIDLDGAEIEARDAFELAKARFQTEKENLDFHEKRLEETRETGTDVEIEAAEADTDAAELEFDKAEEEFDDCESELQDAKLDDSDRAEYEELSELREDISGWQHGVTLIPEDDFEDYCQELCEDIGDIPKDFPSYIVIDWESTCNNLKADYAEIEYQGETYLYRPE